MDSQLQLIPDERSEYHLRPVALDVFPLLLPGPVPTSGFIESVRRFGIVQPVALIEAGRGFSIAAGRRRIAAARAVEMETVPAIIFPCGWTVADVLAIIENEQRSSNPASDLRAIRALVAQGSSHDEICAATGMPKATLDKRLRLLALNEALLLAFEQGAIKTSVAEAAAKLSAARQSELAEMLRESGALKLKDVKAVTRAGAAEAVATLPEMLFDTPAADAPSTDDSESRFGLSAYDWTLWKRLQTFCEGSGQSVDDLISAMEFAAENDRRFKSECAQEKTKCTAKTKKERV